MKFKITKLLLQALAFVTNKLPKTNWKPIPLCDVYGRHGLEAPNLVGHVTAPSVTTVNAAAASSSSIEATVQMTSTGGEAVSEIGVVYMVGSGTPTTSNSKHSITGSFGSAPYFPEIGPITGLSAGTLYSVRAFAINSGGTGYGSVLTATTLSNGPPSVTTNNPTSITTTTATANGNITGTNGATVTERGFVWSTTSDPTVAAYQGKITQTGSYSTGSFTGSMTGLSPSTLYYIRAYAINSFGTSYGDNITFNTSSIPLTKAKGQYKSNFITTVPVGTSSGTDGVSTNIYLQADISNAGTPTTTTVVPKAEVEQLGTAFDNVANKTLRSRVYRNPQSQPTGKRGGGLIYDDVNKRYIFFGGYDGTTRYNDVWEKYIDVPGQTWRRVTVSGTAPSGRNLFGMTFVKGTLTSGGATRAYALIWGGADPNDKNDMFALRLDTPGSEAWTTITQTNAPTVRSYMGGHMVAGAKPAADQQYVYMFGGWGSTRENNLVRCTFDVDTPSAVTWTTLKANGAAGNPSGRTGVVMDYKASTNMLYMYGGYTGSAMLSEFWEYNIGTNTWTNTSPSGTAFTGSEAMAGGYDAANNRFWITGGWTTNGSFTTNRNHIGYIANVGGSESYVEVRSHEAFGTTGDQSFPGHSFAGNIIDPERGWLVLYQMASPDSTERYEYIIDLNEGVTSDYPVYGLADGEWYTSRDAMATAWNPDAQEWVQAGGFDDMADDATITNGTHSSDVWAYSASENRWRYAVSGYKALPPMEGSMMCYDSSRKRMLLFGGLTGIQGNANRVYSLTRDTFGNYVVKMLRPTGTPPSPRWLGACVYDVARDRAIFVMGGNSSGPTSGAFALNFSGSAEGAWTTLTVTGSVTNVAGMGFADKTSAKRLYIQGGATNSTLSTTNSQVAFMNYSDTSVEWTTVSTSGSTSRRTPAMSYDSTNDTIIVFGGFNGSNVINTTSFLPLSGTTWTNVTPTPSPDARRSTIGEVINGKFYMSGGRPNSGTWYNDTWELSPNYSNLSNSTWVNKNPNIYQPVYFSHTGASVGQDFHWQTWTTENGTTDGPKHSFGDNLESAIDFTTRTPSSPTVTTSAATSVTYNAATGNGEVTSDGYSEITERGFVWALSGSADPTTGTNLGKVVVSGTTGTFSGSLSGLTPSTGYKYRAYAINSQGTSYGTAQTFTSGAYSPTSFTLAATISNTGGGTTYVTLFNRTKDLPVGSASTNSSTPTLVTIDIEVGDTNFHDQDEYEIRVRTNGTGNANLYSAKLYIRLHELTKITTWNRISRFGSAALNAIAATTSQRFLYEASNYSNPELFWEITGQEDIAGTNDFGIYNVTTTDTGTTGSVIAETRIDINSATKTRHRVNRISLTDGYRYFGIFNRTSGGARYQSGMIGITASGPKGTVDSQTIIELVDVGRTSQATGVFTPLILRTPFNPADVDNATYFFELIGRNTNTTTPYDVSLLAVNASGTETVASTITMPANTGASNTRYRNSATIPSDTVQLRLRIPQTAVAKQIAPEGARLIIKQTNATRALAYIPLGGSMNEENDETTWPMTTTTQSTFGVVTASEDQATIWKRDDSMYDRYVGLGESPVVVQNTADAATLTTTPTLEFTGTDPEDNDIIYQVQVSDSASMNEFLDNSNLIISNVGGVTGDTTAIDRGQSFTTTSAGDMHSLKVNLSKFGSPTDGVQAKIYTDNGGAPGTLLGTSNNIVPLADMPVSTTAGNFKEALFTFDAGVTLSNATRYWFVIDRTGAADNTNYYSIEGSSATDYGSENGIIWNGSTWNATGVLSLVFQTYLIPTQNIITATSNGSESVVDSYDFVNINSDQSFSTGSIMYDGQTFLGDGSILTSITVRLKYITTPPSSGTVSLIMFNATGTYGGSSIPVEDPSSSIATSNSIALSSLTTSYKDYTFTFTDNDRIVLEDGQLYGFSLSPTQGGSYYVGIDTTSPSHGGNYIDYSDDVSDWNNYTGSDMPFKVNGLPPTPGFSGTPDSSSPFDSGQLVTYSVSKNTAIDSYSISNASSETVLDDGSSDSAPYQTFTGDGSVLKNITVPLRVSGVHSSYDEDIYFEIYAHSGTYGSTGVPTGSPLAVSSTILNTLTDLTDTFREYTFDFTGANAITLASGTNYVLVARGGFRGGDMGAYETYWQSDNTSPTHSGNAGYMFAIGTKYRPTVDNIFSVNKGGPLDPGTYYWRVRGKDMGSNLWGDWSTVRSFTAQESAGTTGQKKVYASGAWTRKPVKYNVGGTWTEKPVKIYSGGSWVESI